MRRLFLPACAAVPLLVTTAWAHDFWIAPPKFRVAKGETVDLPLRVGMEYHGDAVPRDDLTIETFVVLGPDGDAPVRGIDMRDPAGAVTPMKDGIYIVAYRSRRRRLDLPPARFEQYLKDEGLDAAAKLRAARNETEKPSREIYSRCAKALLKAGDGAKDGHDRVAGLRLEIVPETNPYLVFAGAEMSFRVVFEDNPLESGLVIARSRAEPKHVVWGRTDAAGRVKLVLDRAGEWLVKCTHMIPAPAETGMDWESLWASVTFDLDPPVQPGPTK